MKWIFWGSVALIGYTFVGYAGWLWLRSRLRPRAVKTGPYRPFVSVVLVVRDEAAQLRDKLNNLIELNYPSEAWEMVVVSDGSSDASNEILSDFAKNERIRVILSPQAQGKATGLNNALKVCRGEVVVFTDARQELEPD